MTDNDYSAIDDDNDDDDSDVDDDNYDEPDVLYNGRRISLDTSNITKNTRSPPISTHHKITTRNSDIITPISLW